MAAVVLMIRHCLVMNLSCTELSEHALDDASKEVCVLVQLGENTEQILVCKKALFEALVKELVVSLHYVIYCSHISFKESFL